MNNCHIVMVCCAFWMFLALAPALGLRGDADTFRCLETSESCATCAFSSRDPGRDFGCFKSWAESLLEPKGCMTSPHPTSLAMVRGCGCHHAKRHGYGRPQITTTSVDICPNCGFEDRPACVEAWKCDLAKPCRAKGDPSTLATEAITGRALTQEPHQGRSSQCQRFRNEEYKAP